jgi:hypothetical protein
MVALAMASENVISGAEGIVQVSAMAVPGILPASDSGEPGQKLG